MKTKLEIIEDTCNHFNSINRAINEDGGCEYCTTDNRKCAVGRFMINPEKYRGFVNVLRIKNGKLVSLEDVLIPEYHGHELNFWINLQYLHDNSMCWDTNGLSKDGIEYKNELLERWCNVTN